jgi:hypothetical protein
LYNTRRGRETQTAAHRFRSEKRVEDLADRRFVHPAAGALDFQHHVLSRGDVAARKHGAEVMLIHLLHSGAHHNRSVLATHRLPAVNDEVHDELL